MDERTVTDQDSKTQWVQANRKVPCPVCLGEHWCNLRSDGKIAICRRESVGGRHKVDKQGQDYWLHRLTDDPQARERLAYWAAQREASGPPRPLATLDTIHRAYEALLGLLGLNWAHREDLKRRGLREATIEREGFASWPDTEDESNEAADEVYQELGDELFGVPGFWADEDDAPRLCRRGSGWVVPTRDPVTGRYVSLRVRLDTPWSASKYLWVSSSKNNGPGAVVTARLAAPTEPSMEYSDWCVVTEGEVKSIVLANHLGMPAISVPGVGSWELSLDLVRHLRASTVVIAFDADYLDNLAVRTAYLNLSKALEKMGLESAKLCWDGV